MPEKNVFDKKMINDIRIRVQKQCLEVEAADIEINPKHFDASFITMYKDTSYNYTEDKKLLLFYVTYFYNGSNGMLLFNICYLSC